MYLNSTEPYLKYMDDGKIFLQLPANAKGKKCKYVGKWDKSQDTLFTGKKFKNAHLFLRFNSIGFPLLLFESEKEKFKFIIMEYEKELYYTSTYAMLLRGKLVSFYQYNTEVQVHLSLQFWKKSIKEVKKERKMIRNGEIV